MATLQELLDKQAVEQAVEALQLKGAKTKSPSDEPSAKAKAKLRAKTKEKPLPFKARARARRAAQPPQQPIPGFEKVLPFADWCRLKGFSQNTGKRLRKLGKIKVVQLSENRVGITESADREFMRACESA